MSAHLIVFDDLTRKSNPGLSTMEQTTLLLSWLLTNKGVSIGSFKAIISIFGFKWLHIRTEYLLRHMFSFEIRSSVYDAKDP